MEIGKHNTHYRVLKYSQDIAPYEKPDFSNPFKWLWRWFFTRGRWEALFHELFKPYEVIEGEGNCLLNTGIDEMWDLVTGAVSGAGHIYDNSGATIGVGDSATAADPTDTDLKAAANKDYHAMEAGYPTSTSQKATFKSSFGSTHANYTWNEWVVKQATSAICLNRKVESLGTKTTGTWTLEVSITLS